ncbi:MAG: sodium/proton-translocating pyrophosphatase [Elusimicrobia bacterium]|nr:sodium/proton-translocating pyrophosphatase [Elusimicrobiota bacterium]
MSRERDWLRVYAWLEAGACASALASTWAMSRLPALIAAWGEAGPLDPGLRALLAVPCLLPPTILLGATLPVLARFWARLPDQGTLLQGAVGKLYGANTLGAMFIVEMSRQPEEIRKKTDRLNAVGNTTKALTKGYAVGSAALAAFLLFSAYLDEIKNYTGTQIKVDLSKPEVFVAAMIGAMMVSCGGVRRYIRAPGGGCSRPQAGHCPDIRAERRGSQAQGRGGRRVVRQGPAGQRDAGALEHAGEAGEVDRGGDGAHQA